MPSPDYAEIARNLILITEQLRDVREALTQDRQAELAAYLEMAEEHVRKSTGGVQRLSDQWDAIEGRNAPSAGTDASI